MKVYILEGSSGSWDDFSTFVIGVYSSMEALEEGKKQFEEKRKQLLDSKPCPVSEEDAKKVSECQKVAPKIEDAYTRWRYFEVYDLYNINPDFLIDEVDLNVTDLSRLYTRSYDDEQ